MKKSHILFCMIGFALLFTGCVSTTVEQETTDNNPVKNIEESEDKKVIEEFEEKEPESVIPEEPENVVFAKKLKELLEQGRIKEAIELFDLYPELVESDIDLKMVKASLCYSDGIYTVAIEICNEVLAVQENHRDALELISLCNHAMGDKTAYKESAEKILQVDPYNATVNIQKAEDYAINKKYKLARDSYKQALKGNPQNTEALFGYAQMSYYLDDNKTASTTFQKILDIDPKNPAALAYMGKLAAENENYLRASKLVKEAIGEDPNNYDYWMDYGSYLRYQGKFAEAEDAWKKAASLDPSYFLAYAYLAGNYDERNMYQEALENYRMVIETNPKYYFAYEETAILEYHLGNYENAIRYFNKAYEYSDSWAYKLMAFACYKKMEDKTSKARDLLVPLLKTMDKNSTEYSLVRFFYDSYTKNAESQLVGKITKEDNSTKRGKMLFYMGLYYELNGATSLAAEYYAKVTSMQAPMFFEYRIAEWGLGL